MACPCLGRGVLLDDAAVQVEPSHSQVSASSVCVHMDQPPNRTVLARAASYARAAPERLYGAGGRTGNVSSPCRRVQSVPSHSQVSLTSWPTLASPTGNGMSPPNMTVLPRTASNAIAWPQRPGGVV